MTAVGARLREIAAFRWYPVDLLVVTGAAVCVLYGVQVLESGTVLRTGVATLALFFLPGYALTALLFPTRPRQPDQRTVGELGAKPGGIDGVERLGLGVALSITLSVAIALILPLTDWGLSSTTVAATLAGATITFAQLGAVRRLFTPESDRYHVPLVTELAPTDGTLSFSTVLLGVSVCLAIGVLAFALFSPPSAGTYSEIALYGEDEDGDLTLGEFPALVESGEEIPYVLEVTNHADAELEYTLVVEEQHAVNGSLEPLATHAVESGSVDAGASATHNGGLIPVAEENETVRLTFLFYEGSAPSSPSSATADEYTYFWVTHVDDVPETD